MTGQNNTLKYGKEIFNMVKIAEFNLRQYGYRGIEVSVPKVFTADNNLAAGDKVEIFRGQIENKDVLIIAPKDNKDNGESENEQS